MGRPPKAAPLCSLFLLIYLLYNPSARIQTVFFLLSEASGRHLGGFRRLSGNSLGSSLGAGAAMGASRASWTENVLNSLCFTTKTKKEISFRLGFFGVGVTIVCVLQHFSADAEPERPCVNPRWSLRDAARNPTVKALFG